MNTQHYKELLEAELKTLEEEIHTVARKNPSQKGDWEAVERDNEAGFNRADDEEVAEEITEYANNSALLKQLEPRLNEVKTALTRLEDGTYGTCTVCGKLIEEDRLEANPAATTCKEHMNA